MTSRRAIRQGSLVATMLAILWTAGLVFVGGFDLPIGGRIVSSHEPLRPIFWGSLTLAVFVWANGVDRTAATWSRVLSRLPHGLIAAGLALATFVIGVIYASTVATASDAYGYVSQADLWIDGTLKIAQPWAAQAPWPEPAWSFTPLGYKPSPIADEWSLVPIYSPGLPLLMAGAKLVGGQAAMFLWTPLFGAALILATYGIGRQLGSSTAGLVAAWFVMASPTVLFMLALPMIDVPVAALWTVAFFFLMRGNTVLVANGALASAKASAQRAEAPSARRRPPPFARPPRAPHRAAVVNALLGGLTAALALVVRPNLVPLAGVLGLWLLLELRWRRETALRTRILRLVLYTLCVTSAATAIAMLFQYWYGSPLQSGYGGLDVLFAWSNVLPNLRKYLVWLIETQTIFGLAGLIAVLVPLRRLWPGLGDRRVFVAIGLFVAVLWAEYCIYLGFDTWWFLRFLLPSWPFMMLGLAAGLLVVARRGAFGFVVVTWLVVALGAYTFDIGQARGAFTLRRTDRLYVAAAQLTRSMTPENSVVFTLLHSGSMRYYGGRMTMRFDLLDKEWLDRAVAWLTERGIASYALLDGPEVDDFRARFASQQLVRRIDDPAVFTIKGPPALRLYSLSAPAPLATAEPAIDWNALRSTPPVDAPRLVFR